MQSFITQVFDVCKAFQKGMQSTVDLLGDIVKALDQDFTCQDVYAAVGTATGGTLFASFFPGVGPAVNGATKVINFIEKRIFVFVIRYIIHYFYKTYIIFH